MYKHWNMQQYYKKQLLLIRVYIVYWLDRYDNILHNARYIHQDQQYTFFNGTNADSDLLTF